MSYILGGEHTIDAVRKILCKVCGCGVWSGRTKYGSKVALTSAW